MPNVLDRKTGRITFQRDSAFRLMRQQRVDGKPRFVEVAEDEIQQPATITEPEKKSPGSGVHDAAGEFLKEHNSKIKDNEQNDRFSSGAS